MKKRGRDDLEFFARSFFPHLCRLPSSNLHHYLFCRRRRKTRRPLPERRGRIDVALAPRGAAKSTLVSLILPLHALLYGTEGCILLISATRRQAQARLANIRKELADNELLRSVFEEEIASAEADSKDSIVMNGVRIDAFSAGSELRGLTFGGWRPTWIILDDVESSARALASEYREGLDAWMREVIENLGNGYTHIDLIGTLLHPDALPARLAARPNVKSEIFRSIVTEASAAGLWDEWRARLNDLADPRRAETARRFFAEREGEMMAGAKALWPEKESYYDLQVMRASRGPVAFNKEKQNAPPEEGESLLPVRSARRFRLEGRALVFEADPARPDAPSRAAPAVSLDSLRICGFLDPALGGEGAGGGEGDFAAIVTVGADPAGYLYALDAWIERAPPSAQIPRIFDLHERWGYAEFGVEANAFQKCLMDLIEAERRTRAAAGRLAPRSIREVRHFAGKRMRILGLEPLMHNGWLFLNRDLPAEFFRQLEDFPRGRHDDAPDALQGAAALARARGGCALPTQARPFGGRRSVRSF